MSAQITVAPSFKPSSIPNSVFWIDATDPSGTGAVPSNGQTVTTWVNKTSGVPNITGSGVISNYQGRLAMTFPTASFYTTSASVPVSSLTFFMVWLQVVQQGDFGTFNFGTADITWQSNGMGIFTDANGAKPGGSQGYRIFSTAVANGSSQVSTSSYITATSADAVPLNLLEITIDTNGTITVYKNGNLFQTGSRSTPWGGTFNICGFGTDFRYGPASIPTYVSEILIYNTVLTSEQRQKVEGYLTWKWGLQASLPVGHLYSGFSPTSNIPGGTTQMKITVGNILGTTGTVITSDNTTYTFPANVSKVRVFVWGGGGGGSYTTGCGGSGAFVEGDIDKGSMTSLTIYLNRGGGGYGPGGGQIGGGFGAIYNSTNGYLVIAGAGGSGFGSFGYYGGGGGYTQGFQGGSPTLPGTKTTLRNYSNGGGGSQTQGGQGGWGNPTGTYISGDPGGYLQGGNGNLGSAYGQGGGGGYYGGGGGNGDSQGGLYSSCGAGGGGSSYVNPSYVKNYTGQDGQNGSTSSVLPGGSSSPFYIAGYGVGGYNTGGGGALVVIVPYISVGSTNIPLQITLGSSATRAIGGTVTINNSYKVHTFTTVGTSSFVVTPPNSLTVKALIVAGGGGGGGSDVGGGGGGGGAVYQRALLLTPGTYTVTVGAGGAQYTTGGNSSLLTYIGYGGGSGGAGNGGCGGGGSGEQGGGTGSQGYNGSYGNSQYTGGGGGGGMGAPGTTFRDLFVYGYGHFGGDGMQSAITGTPTYYAGGGGGASGGFGGKGGGGRGYTSSTATPGTNGLGGGGGGGAAGGSGTVIISYLMNGFTATPFTPSSISGLTLWYDAADTSTLTISNGNVTQWRDKASSIVLSGATVPYVTSGSYPLLRFNGSLTFTSTTNLPYSSVCTSAANFTCFIVANTSSSTGVNALPLTVYLAGNASRFAPFVNPDGSVFFDGAQQGSPRLGGITQITNTPQLLTFSRTNITTLYGNVNGTLKSTNVFTNPANFANGSYIIYMSQSGAVWKGDMYEVLYFNTDLTTAQVQTIEGYLAWKWGLQASLPGTHAYKYDSPY